MNDDFDQADTDSWDSEEDDEKIALPPSIFQDDDDDTDDTDQKTPEPEERKPVKKDVKQRVSEDYEEPDDYNDLLEEEEKPKKSPARREIPAREHKTPVRNDREKRERTPQKDRRREPSPEKSRSRKERTPVRSHREERYHESRSRTPEDSRSPSARIETPRTPVRDRSPVQESRRSRTPDRESQRRSAEHRSRTPEDSRSHSDRRSPAQESRRSNPVPDDRQPVRDSTVDLFMDPRKVRRTPMPDVDNILGTAAFGIVPSPRKITPSPDRGTRTPSKSPLRSSRNDPDDRKFPSPPRSRNASPRGTPSKDIERRLSNLDTRDSLGVNRTPDRNRSREHSPRTSVRQSPRDERQLTPRQSYDRRSHDRSRDPTPDRGSRTPDRRTPDKNPKDLDVFELEKDPYDSDEMSDLDSEPPSGEGKTTKIPLTDQDNNEKREQQKKRADEIRRRMEEEEAKEKTELIYEFWLMEKQGIQTRKKYTHADSIDEMRFEFHKLKSEGDIKDKVKLGWSVFSCINSLGEMINARFKPFGISIDGWGEDLDSQKSEYEKVFKKIYKNMASRFYIRPGLQLMTMFGTQLMLFLAPRILKKLQTKDEEPRVQELDDNGQPIEKETMKKINQLTQNVTEIKMQFSEQLSRMQQQQMLLLQAQQKFFEQMTTMIKQQQAPLSQNSYQPHVEYQSAPHDPEQYVAQNKRVSNSQAYSQVDAQVEDQAEDDDSEYELVEVEVDDDDDTGEVYEPAVPEPKAKSPPKPNPHTAAPHTADIKNDDEAADSIGEVMSQMQPLVNMFRSIKRKNTDEEQFDLGMYGNEPPEIPESMKEQHKMLEERGIIKPKKDPEYHESDRRSDGEKQSEEKKETPGKGLRRKSQTWDLDS